MTKTRARTLLKVGRSDRSVIARFRDQVRTTALPEDPILLRVYVTTSEDAIHRERQFHQLLEAADHDRSTARTGGTEWFLTSLRFLDAVAATVGLDVHDVYDSEVARNTAALALEVHTRRRWRHDAVSAFRHIAPDRAACPSG
jgi:hypothetical protein